MAKKKRVNVCAIISLAMIVIGIIYVLVCTILKLHHRWVYRIIFAVWVIIYMVLTDFIEPHMINRFRHKNKRQRKAYYKYAILDCVGMLGLLWFVVMAGMIQDVTHYAGIAIFAVCFVPKNVYYKKFNMRQSEYETYEEEEEEDLDSDFDF